MSLDDKDLLRKGDIVMAIPAIVVFSEEEVVSFKRRDFRVVIGECDVFECRQGDIDECWVFRAISLSSEMDRESNVLI